MDYVADAHGIEISRKGNQMGITFLKEQAPQGRIPRELKLR
jgi:hypothetical protein